MMKSTETHLEKRPVLRTGLIALAIMGASAVQSRTSSAGVALSNEALFNRCYLTLTGERPHRNHPLLNRAKQGESAIELCYSIVDNTALNAEGKIHSKNTSIVSTDEALKVARNFHAFHQSWFKANDIRNTVSRFAAEYSVEGFYDETIGSVFLTHILLSDSPYRNLVTGNAHIIAERNNQRTRGQTFAAQPGCGGGGRQLYYAFRGMGGNGGLITGFFPSDAKSETSACSSEFTSKPQDLVAPNSGLLGTPAYIMLNAGLPSDTSPQDGGLYVWRRFTQNVFSDLMCRGLPLVRRTDAIPYVQTASATTPGFRSNATCMSCHTSIDGFAYTIRNVRRTTTHIINGNRDSDFTEWASYYKGRMHSSNFSGKPYKDAMPGSDKDFFRRPPEGKVIFRDYKGNLFDRGPDQIKNLGDAGKALADTDDFYACAASRYIKLFTGHQVVLGDPHDPEFPLKYTQDQLDKLKWIQNQLAPNFKTHQSLKRLIFDIMSHEYFRSSDGNAIK